MNSRLERNKPYINALENKIQKLQEDQEVEFKQEIADEIQDYKNEIKSYEKSFKEVVLEAERDIEYLYLHGEQGDWNVAWSGGKDSTTVAGLVVNTLLKIGKDNWNRKIHFTMSDTLIENPNLQIYMRSQIDKLKQYVEDNDMPITVNMVHRPLEHGYFYLVLGKGYFLPLNSGAGRWCTDRLKLKPQQAWVKKYNPVLQITGVRLNESSRRRASIQKWTEDSLVNRKIANSSDGGINFMAIVDFTIEDVWEYLQKERLPWSSTHDVRTLYKEATGECGFSNPRGVEAKASTLESCGARFGCWVCPVILNDRSTEAMSKYNNWMKPLTDFRAMQFKVMGTYKPIRPEGQRKKDRGVVLREVEAINDKIKMIVKSGYRRTGKKIEKNGKHMTNQGNNTIEAREFLLNYLLDTQRKMNSLRKKNGLVEIELISKEEVDAIYTMWEEDRNERPWLITNSNNISIDRLPELITELEALEP